MKNEALGPTPSASDFSKPTWSQPIGSSAKSGSSARLDVACTL